MVGHKPVVRKGAILGMVGGTGLTATTKGLSWERRPGWCNSGTARVDTGCDMAVTTCALAAVQPFSQ